MAKEEIIERHSFSERKVSDFGQADAYDFKYLSIPNARIAMDEYAKQQAIAFDAWKISNGWSQCMHGKWYKRYPTVGLHSEDLYSIFIEQQNK